MNILDLKGKFKEIFKIVYLLNYPLNNRSSYKTIS